MVSAPQSESATKIRSVIELRAQAALGDIGGDRARMAVPLS
jgi:hypothetical protein